LLKKLSVREVERITRKIATDKIRKHHWQNTDPELILMERMFTETLGTRVSIQKTDFGGKLTIDYFEPADLGKILALMRHEDKSSDAQMEAKEAIVEANAESKEETNKIVEEISEATPLAPLERRENTNSSSAETNESNIDAALTGLKRLESKETNGNIASESNIDGALTGQAPDEKEVNKDDDDNDLYSLKNFSI
jgi:hypothetical protein